MEIRFGTTPFGGRPMSLALLAAQRKTYESLPEGKSVDKWALYRDLCEGKSIIGVSDRALAVLNALLSFYPDSELSEENGLIVFPSNQQLSLRAHGMAGPTLRRHIAALLQAGLILRRDSPNGKRYARKSRAGEVEEAFGFSLAPLVARAEEISQAAEQVRADNAALRLTRERITLLRRDIGKLIEVAIEENLGGDWKSVWTAFRSVVDAIPRRASLTELTAILADLTEIRAEVDNRLDLHKNTSYMNGNDAHIERQQTESNPDSHFELEPAPEKTRANVEANQKRPSGPTGYPLGFVLKACPEIVDYAPGGIGGWHDFVATAAQVRGYLGISPSAYDDALDVLGAENTAIVIACILQRADRIGSPGGYLRALTDKARSNEFSVGPMLMSGFKANSTMDGRTA